RAVMRQDSDPWHGPADHAEAVAGTGCLRMRKDAQRQNEQHGGDEVGEGGQAGGHLCVSYCRRLNMDSMRWVTMNQTKMFTLARVNPLTPNANGQPLVPIPVASMAPTTMTDEIALFTYISGECSAGVTFHTT